MPNVISPILLVCRALGQLSALRRAPVQHALAQQLQGCGVQALPGLLCAGVALGLIAVQQMHGTYGANVEFTLRTLLQLLLSELAPLLTAVFLIARSSSAMAAELAAIRVQGEWRLLGTMGIDPLAYLLLPRLLALTLASGVLALYLLLTAQLTAVLYALDSPDPATLYSMLEPLSAGLIAQCLGKSLLFGGLIGLISCASGVAAHGNWTAIPRASARAVVRALLAVFAADALWALLPGLWSGG